MAITRSAAVSKISGPKRKAAVSYTERLRDITIQGIYALDVIEFIRLTESKDTKYRSSISDIDRLLGGESVATRKQVKEEFEHEQKEEPLTW